MLLKVKYKSTWGEARRFIRKLLQWSRGRWRLTSGSRDGRRGQAGNIFLGWSQEGEERERQWGTWDTLDFLGLSNWVDGGIVLIWTKLVEKHWEETKLNNSKNLVIPLPQLSWHLGLKCQLQGHFSEAAHNTVPFITLSLRGPDTFFLCTYYLQLFDCLTKALSPLFSDQ